MDLPTHPNGAAQLDLIAAMDEVYADRAHSAKFACGFVLMRPNGNKRSKSRRRHAMPLQHLQHFLIQTEDLEKTKDWYVDVLGMRVGPHPDFKFPVYWLYLGDDDVLHITHWGC